MQTSFLQRRARGAQRRLRTHENVLQRALLRPRPARAHASSAIVLLLLLLLHRLQRAGGAAFAAAAAVLRQVQRRHVIRPAGRLRRAVLPAQRFSSVSTHTAHKHQRTPPPATHRTRMKRGKRSEMPRSACTRPAAAVWRGDSVRSAPRISHTSRGASHTCGVSPVL